VRKRKDPQIEIIAESEREICIKGGIRDLNRIYKYIYIYIYIYIYKMTYY